MSTRQARITLFTGLALTGGFLAGAIVGATSYAAYLVIVSPAIAAVAAGGMTGAAARVAKLPAPRFVTAIGALAGIAAMISILMVTLQIERSQVITTLSTTAGLGDEAIARAAERWQAEATGNAGEATAWFELRLESGVRLFGETRLDLTPGLNGALLLIELALAGLVAARLARRRATEPFCENCDAWYSRRIVGTAPLGALATLRAELQSGRYHRLGRRLGPPTAKAPVILHGLMCDTCSRGDVTFELEASESGGRPRLVKVVEAPHEALDAILDSQALLREDAKRGA